MSSYIESQYVIEELRTINQIFPANPIVTMGLPYGTVPFTITPLDLKYNGMCFCYIKKIALTCIRHIGDYKLPGNNIMITDCELIDIREVKGGETYEVMYEVPDDEVEIDFYIWSYSTDGLLNPYPVYLNTYAYGGEIYGFIEHFDDLNPETRIEYIGQNQFFQPMHTNVDTGEATYGDWDKWDWLMDVKPYLVWLYSNPNYYAPDLALDPSNINKLINGDSAENPEDVLKYVTKKSEDLPDPTVDFLSYKHCSFIPKLYTKNLAIENGRVVLYSRTKKQGFNVAKPFLYAKNEVRITSAPPLELRDDCEGFWFPLFYQTGHTPRVLMSDSKFKGLGNFTSWGWDKDCYAATCSEIDGSYISDYNSSEFKYDGRFYNYDIPYAFRSDYTEFGVWDSDLRYPTLSMLFLFRDLEYLLYKTTNIQKHAGYGNSHLTNHNVRSIFDPSKVTDNGYLNPNFQEIDHIKFYKNEWNKSSNDENLIDGFIGHNANPDTINHDTLFFSQILGSYTTMIDLVGDIELISNSDGTTITVRDYITNIREEQYIDYSDPSEYTMRKSLIKSTKIEKPDLIPETVSVSNCMALCFEDYWYPIPTDDYEDTEIGHCDDFYFNVLNSASASLDITNSTGFGNDRNLATGGSGPNSFNTDKGTQLYLNTNVDVFRQSTRLYSNAVIQYKFKEEQNGDTVDEGSHDGETENV